MDFLVGAAVIAVIWAVFAFRKKQRAFSSHSAADLAAPWLADLGVDRDSLMFNAYDEPGVARVAGATVIVGVGKHRSGRDFGFVAEVVSGRGVVDGTELTPWGIATWDRTALRTAIASNRPLMDVLLEMATRHRAETATRSHLPSETVGESKRHHANVDVGRSEATSGEPAPWLVRFGSAPDFMSRQPVSGTHTPGYFAVHVKDVRPIAARLSNAPSFPLHYLHALVVINTRSSEPELFVTLEKSISETPFLGVFRKDGSRSNLGDGNSKASDEQFLRYAVELANKELGLRMSITDFRPLKGSDPIPKA